MTLEQLVERWQKVELELRHSICSEIQDKAWIEAQSPAYPLREEAYQAASDLLAKLGREQR